MSAPTSFVQALCALPHGPEFRFVDELLALEPGVSSTGSYRLRGDEAFLRGHFPGYPLMPGVLMIEALAQLGGVILQTRPGVAPMTGLKLTAVQRFKILGSILPGDVLLIEARLDHVLGTLAQVSGTLKNGAGEVMASGSIALAGDAAS
jgi:3-hydroxyacyl-[acyl-carrier-protein] dehydratase